MKWITLKGDRDVDKSDLIKLGVMIAEGKLRLTQILRRAGDANPRPCSVKRYRVVDESGTHQTNSIHIVYELMSETTQEQGV